MASNMNHEIANEIVELVAKSQSLILATAAPGDATPNASYAPFVEDRGQFFILVSGLAKHTANLIGSRRCHVMFIADEAASVNVFARKRVSFLCEVHEFQRDDPRSDAILDEMTRRFGPTIGMLRSLPDFRLLGLSPGEGTFVRGFGQAIPIEGFPLMA